MIHFTDWCRSVLGLQPKPVPIDEEKLVWKGSREVEFLHVWTPVDVQYGEKCFARVRPLCVSVTTEPTPVVIALGEVVGSRETIVRLFQSYRWLHHVFNMNLFEGSTNSPSEDFAMRSLTQLAGIGLGRQVVDRLGLDDAVYRETCVPRGERHSIFLYDFGVSATRHRAQRIICRLYGFGYSWYEAYQMASSALVDIFSGRYPSVYENYRTKIQPPGRVLLRTKRIPIYDRTIANRWDEGKVPVDTYSCETTIAFGNGAGIQGDSTTQTIMVCEVVSYPWCIDIALPTSPRRHIAFHYNPSFRPMSNCPKESSVARELRRSVVDLFWVPSSIDVSHLSYNIFGARWIDYCQPSMWRIALLESSDYSGLYVESVIAPSLIYDIGSRLLAAEKIVESDGYELVRQWQALLDIASDPGEIISPPALD